MQETGGQGEATNGLHRQRMLKFKSHATLYLVILHPSFPSAIRWCGYGETLLCRHVYRSLDGRIEGRDCKAITDHQRGFKQEGQA